MGLVGVAKQLRLTTTNAELGFGFGCVVIDVNLIVIYRTLLE